MRILRIAAVAAIVAAPGLCASQASTPLSDSAFVALSQRLSETGGFFDTDNLISNEDSYLHPITTLRRLGVSGGVYIGVGPEQSFSYIAEIRPRIAFMVDIRRDNLLEHVLFKSIFALSRNRIDYLCLLFGRTPPPDTTGWSVKSVEAILDYAARAPPDASVRARVIAQAGRSRLANSPADVATISRFYGAFVADGPALRFTSLGRAPQSYYPDYRRLATETDRNGKQASFLSTEERFQVVKSLEDANRIVPVVGDFAGSHALGAIADWMAANRETLSALYSSNVEQYLFRDGGFDTFVKSVARLPRDAKSVIIRSCFTCTGGHEQSVSGYHSVQMLQLVGDFVAYQAAGRFQQYRDVVTLGLVPP